MSFFPHYGNLTQKIGTVPVRSGQHRSWQSRHSAQPVHDFSTGVSTEELAPPYFQTSGARAIRLLRTHSLLSRRGCNSVVTVLSLDKECLLLLKGKQGDLLFSLDEMNHVYVNWLESLPCNRKLQTVNQWMGEWAPLPEHVDLPRYEGTPQRWIERDCPDAVMSRLWRWVGGVRCSCH